jgi:2-phosphosulfolactate phosphatase
MLFSEIVTREPFIVVLADILRATTSICAAFHNGVAAILPVATTEEAKALKEQGFLVASEQDGKKLDFADFGNSAFSFTREAVGGKEVVYCTTNGTRALHIAREAEQIVVGSFSNLTALTRWLTERRQNVVILCSGWKNKLCLEDTLFAGALTSRLLADGTFISSCDSAAMALDLWSLARPDILGYTRKAAHFQRLKTLALDDVIPFSFKIDTTGAVPVYRDGRITDDSINP